MKKSGEIGLRLEKHTFPAWKENREPALCQEKTEGQSGYSRE
jgi:hypothetical protein